MAANTYINYFNLKMIALLLGLNNIKNSFISLDRCVWSSCHLPGTVLGNGNTIANKRGVVLFFMVEEVAEWGLHVISS